MICTIFYRGFWETWGCIRPCPHCSLPDGLQRSQEATTIAQETSPTFLFFSERCIKNNALMEHLAFKQIECRKNILWLRLFLLWKLPSRQDGCWYDKLDGNPDVNQFPHITVVLGCGCSGTPRFKSNKLKTSLHCWNYYFAGCHQKTVYSLIVGLISAAKQMIQIFSWTPGLIEIFHWVVFAEHVFLY